jgi:hypothetical protein
MAKAFRHGKGWCVRQRHAGKTYRVSGHPTQVLAEHAMRVLIREVQDGPAPPSVWAGPTQVTLAQALQAYGLERLQRRGLAPQEKRHINRYLTCAGWAPLCAGSRGAGGNPAPVAHQPAFQPEGTQPASVRLRTALARRPVASVCRHDILALLNALDQEGATPSALAGERAFLRCFYNYVREHWRWAYPVLNPATGLALPAVLRVRKPQCGSKLSPVPHGFPSDVEAAWRMAPVQGVEHTRGVMVLTRTLVQEVSRG